MNEPDEAPFYGPQLPLYPAIEQVCRVYASALAGTNVYPAYMQQYAGALAFRDREPCYVVEPNGITLRAGRYDCRLVGSYLGLPLLATTCCPVGAYDSSSSGSSG